MLGGWSRRTGTERCSTVMITSSHESCASEKHRWKRPFGDLEGICICLREDFLSRSSLAGREVYQSAYSFKKTK